MKDSALNSSEKCVIRMGVFFDGTGKNGTAIDGTPYELFNMTNIYRLYKLYGNDQRCGTNRLTGKIYIEGIGTLNNHPDDIYSIVTGDEALWGIEGYGPDSKLKICHERLACELERVLETGASTLPKSVGIEFDVFGFSRGAVLARHFINTICEKNAALLDQIRSVTNKLGYDFQSEPIVNFMGLFDTVGAFMDSTVLDNDPHDTGYTRNLKVNVPAGAVRNAFQLNAMHEYRYNFPLHSLYGHYPELTIAGAHSDVGGGYPEKIREVKDLTTHKYWVPFSWAKTRAKEELSPLLKSKSWAFLSKHIQYQGSEKFYCMATSHRQIEGHLQFVALVTMARVAEACGCDITSEIKTYEDMIPHGMVDYYHHVCQRAIQTLEGKPKTLDHELVQKVIPAYVHMSASWLTIKELYDDMRHNSQVMVCRGNEQSSQHKILDISVINNFWPDRPDDNWERKVFK